MNKGDGVMYVGYDGTDHAALVVSGDTTSGVLNLVVFAGSPVEGLENEAKFSVHFRENVVEGTAPGQWHK